MNNKINGILVVNHFLNGNKFNELHRHLVDTARKMNISLEVKTNLQLAIEKVNTDFVLFWDKDVTLAKALEAQGLKVFNSSNSIYLCDNKALTYNALKNIVSQPDTICSPLVYANEDLTEFVKAAVDTLGLPVVYKDCFGSFGFQVHLCNSIQEILELISQKPFILQKYIQKSSGSDVRIEVVGGKFVSAVERKNANDFRSNITNGGIMLPYTPTDYEKQLAITACNALGLTFGGVDILDHKYVCEVNSNAHIINIMNTNSINIAKIIFNEILECL